jgi:16S rRNA processing protein RimM
MSEKKFITIGNIKGVHGLHGNLKVVSYVDSDALYQSGSKIVVQYPDSHRENHSVVSVSPYKKGFLLRLDDISDINAAEKLKGSDLLVPREALPEIDPEEEQDTWYWVDLIGLNVKTVEGEVIGILRSIFRTGSNDVYVVGEGKDEILIPAIDKVIVSVDLDSRLMVVDLPEGL